MQQRQQQDNRHQLHEDKEDTIAPSLSQVVSLFALVEGQRKIERSTDQLRTRNYGK